MGADLSDDDIDPSIEQAHGRSSRAVRRGILPIRVNNQWRLVFRCAGSGGEAEASISTTTATDEASHADDKAQAGDGGEILVEEFMQPMGLTQAALVEAVGVQRKHVNELCNHGRNVTAATALILARVFGNSPDF
jgi:addiction module HigA family antidote